MRYGILADIHGNLLALNAALADMQEFGNVEVLISLGDMIGYGPFPHEVVETLRGNGAILLQGNHEEAIARFNPEKNRHLHIDILRMMEFTRAQFSDAETQALTKLPKWQMNDVFRTEHSTSRGVTPWPYVWPDSFEAILHLRFAEKQLSFVGHTHCQSTVTLDRDGKVKHLSAKEHPCLRASPGVRYLLNPGSIGQPRDGDKRAAYIILDLVGIGQSIIHFRKVAYDVDATIRHMRARHLPQKFADRLRNGNG